MSAEDIFLQQLQQLFINIKVSIFFDSPTDRESHTEISETLGLNHFLVSVSKIHIFLVSVSVSNICEQESRSRLLRLYLFSLGLGLAC